MARKIKGEPWTGEGCKEPIEIARSLYRCPDCDFRSAYKIAVLSHYRHNHHGREVSKLAEKEKQQKKERNGNCCKYSEYRLLSARIEIEKKAIDMGYSAVCKNCEELI